MGDVPMVSIIALDDRDVRVPSEWEQRFIRAKREDVLNGHWFLGVFMESYKARNAACDEFKAAIDAGIEVQDF